MTITIWNQDFQKVTKSDFDTFIAFYPRKLERHLVTFGEPPLLTFNDFTIGKYPKSIVAGKYCREDDGWQDEYWVSCWESAWLPAAPEPQEEPKP